MGDELERLRRLRDRQLADRNPKEKQKQFQYSSLQKERKAANKPYSLGDAWRTIPHVVRSPLIAFLIGLCVSILLQFVWKSPWALWAGLGAIVFLIVIGVMIGQALDVRDNLRDYSKH